MRTRTAIGLCFGALMSFALEASAVGESEVRQCVQDLYRNVAGGQCSGLFSIESVTKVDAREGSTEASVIADIVFRVLQPMAGNVQATQVCTGRGWVVEVKNPYRPNSAQWLMYQSQADMSGGYLQPQQRLKVRKTFKFEKWQSGWRCAEKEMAPIELGWFVEGPSTSSPSTGKQSAVTGPQAAIAGCWKMTKNTWFKVDGQIDAGPTQCSTFIAAGHRASLCAGDKGSIFVYRRDTFDTGEFRETALAPPAFASQATPLTTKYKLDGGVLTLNKESKAGTHMLRIEQEYVRDPSIDCAILERAIRNMQ